MVDNVMTLPATNTTRTRSGEVVLHLQHLTKQYGHRLELAIALLQNPELLILSLNYPNFSH